MTAMVAYDERLDNNISMCVIQHLVLSCSSIMCIVNAEIDNNLLL